MKRPAEVAGDGPQLFKALRQLDPNASMQDYVSDDVSTGIQVWDLIALREDLQLTQCYMHTSLQEALAPIRQEIKMLTEATARCHGVVRVSPEGVRPILLSDGESAKDTERLRQCGVEYVINCSPQTVRTGPHYYGTGLQYLELWPDDFIDYCIMKDFGLAWSFAMSPSSAGAVLLHCEQGVNRSGALAVAFCLRLRESELSGRSPEDQLRLTWRGVVERRGKVMTNASFQRQLLVFARMGARWFPSVQGLWRTPVEARMAYFRAWSERLAQKIVEEPCMMIPPDHHQRMVIYIRDSAMRGEVKINPSFNYEWDKPECHAIKKAENRIRSFAYRNLEKKLQEYDEDV